MELTEVRNFISEKILMKIIKGLFIALVFFFAFSVSIREILIGLLFITYVINKLINVDFSLPKTVINKEIIIFLLFSFLSLIRADQFLLSLEEIIVSPFKYIVFFYIAYDLINKEEVEKYFNILFFGSLSLLITAKIVYLITGNNFTHYIRSNEAGSWLSFSILMFLYFLFIKKEKSYKKYFALVGLILSINTLFITNSRGAFLAFFSGLLITIFFMINKKVKNKKKLFAIILILVALFVVVIPQVLPERLISKFENLKNINSHWSLKTRVIMWKSSIYNIKNNPLLGVGIRDFQTNYLDYIDNVLKIDVPAGARNHDHPHNLFLYIAVEQGIISLIVFILILYKSFKSAISNYINFNINKLNFYFGLILIGIITSLVVHSMVDTTFRYGNVAYFIILFVIFNFKKENINIERRYNNE